MSEALAFCAGLVGGLLILFGITILVSNPVDHYNHDFKQFCLVAGGQPHVSDSARDICLAVQHGKIVTLFKESPQ